MRVITTEKEGVFLVIALIFLIGVITFYMSTYPPHTVAKSNFLLNIVPENKIF